jgi:peroxiredoxin
MIFAVAAWASSAVAELAGSPQEIQPIETGLPVPSAWLKTVRGQSVDLNESVLGMPTVLVFYRGGWCPYCMRQLAELQKIEDKLRELGYQVVAVSPDPPDKLRATVQKLKIGFTLLSDNEFLATQAFGLVYKLDAATIAKYEEFDIPLYSPSDSVVKALPVPAVYLVSPEGVIVYAKTSPDYTVRLSAEEILAAAKDALTAH